MKFIKLLIEPKWNVNLFVLASSHILHFLLIEPKWNVNTQANSLNAQGIITFNRTKVECKLL